MTRGRRALGIVGTVASVVLMTRTVAYGVETDWFDLGRTKVLPRVVNGKVVKLKPSSPFVYLGGCTGTLITKTVIITAKHCESLVKRQGLVKTPTEIIPISGTITMGPPIADHPEGSVTRDMPTDFLLITLQKPATGTPAPFLYSKKVKVGDLVMVAGYGIDEKEKPAFRMGQTRIFGVRPTFFVTRLVTGFASPCHGDSGSALWAYYKKRSGGYGAGIVATTSGGTNDCKPGDQVMYPNLQVAEIMKFIRAKAPGVKIY